MYPRSIKVQIYKERKRKCDQVEYVKNAYLHFTTLFFSAASSIASFLLIACLISLTNAQPPPLTGLILLYFESFLLILLSEVD